MKRSGGSFYVCQGENSRDNLKAGKSNENPVDRVKSYETGGGPHRLLFCCSGLDDAFAFEKMIFDRLRKYRLKRETRDYELFRAHQDVFLFLRGATARELGIVQIARPYSQHETLRQYLSRAARYGCEAATFALAENQRLRERTPKTARGGWVLQELMSGSVAQYRQIELAEWGIESQGVELSRKHGWAMHRITYRGTPFAFPVLKEVCDREHVRAPPGAVSVGLRYWSRPALPSGRKGRPLNRPVPVIVFPGQTSLFDERPGS